MRALRLFAALSVALLAALYPSILAHADVSNTGIVSGTVQEGDTLTLTAPEGAVFSDVVFASYGTPDNYTVSDCNADNSADIVASAFIGHNSGNIAADNSIFGDPCGGTYKKLSVTLRWVLLAPINQVINTAQITCMNDAQETRTQTVRYKLQNPNQITQMVISFCNYIHFGKPVSYTILNADGTTTTTSIGASQTPDAPTPQPSPSPEPSSSPTPSPQPTADTSTLQAPSQGSDSQTSTAPSDTQTTSVDTQTIVDTPTPAVVDGATATVDVPVQPIAAPPQPAPAPAPMEIPNPAPSQTPTPEPSASASPAPTPQPTDSASPIPTPSATPTPEPSKTSEPQPSPLPKPAPSAQPVVTPSPQPLQPSPAPTPSATKDASTNLIPNNPNSLPDTTPKAAPAESLVAHIQEDKPGVENGGIDFFGTKSQPQVVGEDGKLTPPAPPPGSGLPIPPDAITTSATFIGQPGGTTFNAPDIAVPVVETPVKGALAAVPGVQALNHAFVAVANIGNDMSPVTRKKAKKILVATLVVGQIAQLRRRF